MKKSIYLLPILALLLCAISCQNNGLDNGQAIDNGKLTLTATIVAPEQTRVTYDVDNETTHTVTPSWTVGDKIIGFDDQGATFTFEVTAVDGSGKATLDDGGYTPGVATKLYAIYAPGKLATDISAGKLAVNLGTQSGTLNAASPVLMCVTADIAGSAVTLAFENQTAIIGVTKFKLPAAATLTSISVDGLITSGTFEVNGSGDLVLTPAAAPATATATGSWATGAENICETAIYFATLPTAAAKIALRASDGVNDYGNLASIAATDIAAGNYYYMAKNLGAPVAEVAGVKYGTIDDAWAAANRANSAVTVTLLANCSAAARLALDATGTGAVTFDLNGHNLVTANQIRVTGRNLTLTDNSSAVLAEQGVISTTYSGGRLVYVNGGSFTMLGGTVSRTGISGNYQAVFGQNSASITLSGGKVVTDHSGVYAETESSITIDGNTIIQTDSTGVNNNGGTLLIEGSPVITASLGGAGYGVRSQGTGTTTIRGTASITGDNAVYAQTGTTVTISGNPTAHSDAGSTLYAAAGTINISGGTFSRGGTGNGYVAYTGNADGRINISGGTFTNTPSSSVVRAYTSGSVITVTGGCFISKGINPIDVYNGTVYVSGGVFNKPVQPTYAVDASSNEYVNVLNTDPSTAESCPFTLSAASATPKAATVTQMSYAWEFGTVDGAFKAADLRANSNGTSTVTLDDDCAATSTLTIGSGNKYLTIVNLNNHTLSSSISPAVTASSELMVKNTGAGGELVTSGETGISVAAGTTTLNGVSVVAATTAVAVASGATLAAFDSYLYGGDTADITDAGGTIALSGGWFRNEPNVSWVSDGYQKAAGTETFQARTYNWQLEALPAVATVNGAEYPTWASAVAAATAFAGATDTVRLVLVDDIADASPVSLEHASLPVLLDLNGHILATADSAFIKCQYNLTVTDNGVSRGKITSSETSVICKVGTGTINLRGVTIECTKASASWSNAGLIYLNNTSSTLNILDGCKIYSTKAVTAVNNKGGNLTIADSEISSGTVSAGCPALCCGNSNCTTTINSGSFYTSATSRAVLVNAAGYAAGVSAGTVTINGGYFYASASATSALKGNYASGNHMSKITVNGGYFNKSTVWTNSDKNYPPTYGAGVSEQSCSETYTHETTGETYTYTFKVDTTPEP